MLKIQTHLIKICSIEDIDVSTNKALLCTIGYCTPDRAIKRWIPKSQVYTKDTSIYVPMWLAKSLGITIHYADYLYSNLQEFTSYEATHRRTTAPRDDIPF